MDVPWPRGLRWRAMIFHMARRTGFREQYYTGTRDISVSGKIAGNIKVKLYMRLWWLFINISGLINSFELSSFVVSDIISLLLGIAAGSSRKSIWERLGCTKVSCMMQMSHISWSEAVRSSKMAGSEPKGPRWRAMLNSTWLEELASESNTIQAQEELSWQGRLQAKIREKIYVRFGRFSSIFLDWSIRLSSRCLWI